MYKIQLTKIATVFIEKQDRKTQEQILKKIEILQENPLIIGKPLQGNLKEYRSIRSVGQRHRIIYSVIQEKVTVIIVAVGMRKEGGKKDIYELMKKYIKTGLLESI